MVLYLGVEDRNSGPNAYRASTLPTVPPLQPGYAFFNLAGFALLLYFVFEDRLLLCSPSQAWTTDPPAFASQVVLRSQVCPPSTKICFLLSLTSFTHHIFLSKFIHIIESTSFCLPVCTLGLSPHCHQHTHWSFLTPPHFWCIHLVLGGLVPRICADTKACRSLIPLHKMAW